MTYSKKQMKPLIDKFQINPETNKLFMSVVEMFDNQPNYQFWAVKCIFNKVMSFDTLAKIHDWAGVNQTMIKNLEKKNIVSYSSEALVRQLLLEMEALDNVAIIKDVISHFNTEQRRLLTEAILPQELNGLEASRSEKVGTWGDIFTKFNRLPLERKNNFYTKASGVHDVHTLMSLIVDCLQESYLWNKDDFLAYLINNTHGCEVVYENGLVLIISVPDFNTSKLLCGLGRTQWCISMEQHHWDNYVGRTSNNRRQYFLFDFNRRETDPFAHIGFTIEKGSGIVEAQSGDNEPMMSDYSNGRETFNIHTALQAVGAKMGDLITIQNNSRFTWDAKSVREYIKSKPEWFSIAYDKGDRIVVNVLATDGLQDMTSHTFMPSHRIYVDTHEKVYLLLDFNLQYNDERAMVFMRYSKDLYGSYSFINAFNLFGTEVKVHNLLEGTDMTQNDFLNMEKVDPSILLHKYIDLCDEKAAIDLINSEWDNIDVNFQFNNKLPIYQLLNNRLFNLFSVVVSHPTFDTTMEDGFGESLLEGMIYLYAGDDIVSSEAEEKSLESMIKAILDNKAFDANHADWNNDTALKIACEFFKTTWIVKELVKNPLVNVNVTNDQGQTPLYAAIENGNIESVDALCSRVDLNITDKERKLAEKLGVTLNVPAGRESASDELALATSVTE